MIHKYKSASVTNFRWLIPFIIGCSKYYNNDKSGVYSINITPFIEILFGFKGTKFGNILED